MIKKRNRRLRIAFLVVLAACMVLAAHLAYGDQGSQDWQDWQGHQRTLGNHSTQITQRALGNHSTQIIQAAKRGQNQPRVFDQAGLFTTDERASLEARIASMRERIGMDIVIVTTDDADGKSSRDYADDYYDYHGFGVGGQASGALFLIDMDNREIYISTAGAMIRFLTDQRIDAMLDHGYESVAAAEYGAAADVFLEDLENNYNRGIPDGQYNYDAETGEISVYRSIQIHEALLALAVAGICAGGACYRVKREYAMKKERAQGSNYLYAYRTQSHFALTEQNDRFLTQSVTHRVIPRSENQGHGSGHGGFGQSTTHHSSGGRSHGGGGRKF